MLSALMGANQSAMQSQQGMQQQQQQQQQLQATQQQPQAQTADVPVKGGGMTSLAAQHAAAKLAQMTASTSDTKLSASSSGSAKSSAQNSRSNSLSGQGPFESASQSQIQAPDPAPTPANASGSTVPAAAAFPSRPVSSRGHMLPQSAQMISEKERQREAEMEHIFSPQPGQIIAERCTKRHSLRERSAASTIPTQERSFSLVIRPVLVNCCVPVVQTNLSS
jgi:hypothetical protein